MKNFRYIIYYILFVCVFQNCGSSPSRSDSTNEYVDMIYPIEIDAHKGYEKKTLDINDIADIEYIPLETRNDILLSNNLRGLSVSDSMIITFNQQNTIFTFNKDGSLKSQFNHAGQGANEYQSISNITVDLYEKEIYIYDYRLKYRVLVYSTEGEFKRSFDIPTSLFIDDFVDYDKEHLLAYITFAPSGLKKHKGPFSPYYLMSKKNGELKPLDFEVPQIIDGKIRATEKTSNGSRGRTVGYSTSPLIRNGKEFFISDFACDTMYMLKDGVREPYIVCKPSLQVDNPLLFMGISLKTTRYTFLQVIKHMPEEMKVDSKVIAIDHKTGKIFEPEFQKSNFIYVPDNYFRNLPTEHSVIVRSSLRLVEAYEKDELEGELKEIASHLKEDDNPVLMLVKFKK